MSKKGFTLTELLAVIAIIAIITLIAVPSIIAINRRMNERMFESKKELIISSAELYARDNPDIFNGQTEVKKYVYELINAGYLKPDVKNNEGKCSGNEEGCLIDPRDKSSLNNEHVLIIKEAVGAVAIFGGESCSDNDSNPNNRCESGTLVKQVCEKFNNGKFVGKFGSGANDYCGCKMNGETVSGIYKATKNSDNTLNISNTAVKACIISGDDVNNYLRYDGVMYRVIGVYDLYNDSNKLVAKMITNTTVDDN